jgi:undecaprenyl-diphosphatase
VRAFIPLIAGMFRMPVRRFYIANILSALVWAPSHILPAVFVGAAFSLFGAAAKPLAILLFLIVIVIWTAIRLVRLALRHGPPLLSRLSTWLTIQWAGNLLSIERSSSRVAGENRLLGNRRAPLAGSPPMRHLSICPS